jgi:hypothetical protein
LNYVLNNPREVKIDMERRAFAISRGYMVHPRGGEGFYIVGPRDSFDRQAARKGQARTWTLEADAWQAAWLRAQAKGRAR